MHKNERDSLLKPNKAFPSLSPGLYDTLKVDVLHSVHIDFTRCSLGKSRDKELSVWRFWGRRKGLLENKSRFSLTVGLSCREITNLCLLSVCGGQSNVRMEKKRHAGCTDREKSVMSQRRGSTLACCGVALGLRQVPRGPIKTQRHPLTF